MVDFCNEHETGAGGSNASVLKNFKIIGKSAIEQIKELKELVDLDIIFLAEFDLKKNELLGF